MGGASPRKVEFKEIEEMNECKKRKILHRDIERHRRQEMAALYASLGSLLPNEYTKGKRSISDHMLEAMNYIRNIQGRIQELRERRDELLSNSSCPQGNNDVVCVSLQSCLEIVEIQMKCLSSKRELRSLPKVLTELINSDLRVTCCILSRYDNRMFFTIQAKVNDPDEHVDPVLLKQKLMEAAVFGSAATQGPFSF